LSSYLLSKNVKTAIYKSTVLPVLLYGCETWSLILREEHRLRVLRRLFGQKRNGVVGGQRKLDKDELHNLYSSPGVITMTKSRRMRWAGHVAHMGRRGMHIGLWWESQKERDH
jgi:hypothetical protein